MKNYLKSLLVCGALISSCQSVAMEQASNTLKTIIPSLLHHIGPRNVMRILNTPLSTQRKETMKKFIAFSETKLRVDPCAFSSDQKPWLDRELQTIRNNISQQFGFPADELTQEAGYKLCLFFKMHEQMLKQNEHASTIIKMDSQRILDTELEQLQYSKEEIINLKIEAAKEIAKTLCRTPLLSEKDYTKLHDALKQMH